MHKIWSLIYHEQQFWRTILANRVLAFCLMCRYVIKYSFYVQSVKSHSEKPLSLQCVVVWRLRSIQFNNTVMSIVSYCADVLKDKVMLEKTEKRKAKGVRLKKLNFVLAKTKKVYLLQSVYMFRYILCFTLQLASEILSNVWTDFGKYSPNLSNFFIWLFLCFQSIIFKCIPLYEFISCLPCVTFLDRC